MEKPENHRKPGGSSLGSHHKAIKPLKVDGRSWRRNVYGFASEVWKTMADALHRKTWILKIFGGNCHITSGSSYLKRCGKIV